MKKTAKRILAVVLTLAMMLTGINWPVVKAKAAEGTSSTTITELSAPTDVMLLDYHQTGEGYVINFTDNDASMTVANGDTKAFEVYVGGELVATVSKPGETIDSLEGHGFASGTQYEVTVKEVLTRTNALGGTDTLSAESVDKNYINYNNNEVLENGISKVFVNTSRTDSDKNFDLFTNPDKTKIDAAIMVVDEKGVSQVKGTDFGTIARRGNSTGGGQKKPYNIKFESKQDLFGFGKAKKWSLLANTFDKSMIRNQTGISFHNYVEDNFQDDKYTSLGEVVDLYVDGYYLGTYYLLESVEAKDNRVEIDAENEDSVNNEILLELDATGRDLGADAHLRKEGDAAYHTRLEKSGYYFTMNGPEGPGSDGNDEDTVAERNEFWDLYWDKSAYAYDYLTAFEEEISKGADSNFNTISQMIDVDSFVNYYITAELFKITDVAFSSVRHYIKVTDGGVYDEATGKSYKLYAGPLWDLDLSSGNNDNTTVEQLHAQDNYWFGQLMKNATFKDLVRQRYEELLPKIKDIYAEGGLIDEIVANSQASIDANYSVAYNVHNGNTGITPVTGYGTGWEIDKVYDAGNHAYTPGEFVSGNVHGSEIVYDNHAEYVEDFREWMEGRNEYLMKQFGAADKDAVYTEYEDMIADRFYNLALNKETTLYNSCNEGSQICLNDGLLTANQNANGSSYCALSNATSGWGTENAPAYFTIDLGQVYDAADIDEIFVQYKGADQAICTVQGRLYQILYSVDGSENSFYEVASVENATLDENNRTIDKVSTATGFVRYVRVYYPQQAAYGMQIVEAAVLDTDKNAVAVEGEEVPVPTVTASTPEGVYNTITGTITANANAVAGTTYAIYLNGTKYATLDAAGEFTLTDIAAGTYEVTVKAVSGGWESDATETITVTVEDDPDKVEDVNWVPLNGTSKYEETAYVVDGVQNTFGNAGHRGFYAAGTTNKWQITEAFDALDVFGFVTTGANATSIVIDGIEYTSDDTNVLIGGDCVYINQELLKVPAGQAYKIFTITATGSSVGDNGTFQLKVEAEAAPDTSDVDTSAWKEIPKKGTGSGRVPNTYYINQAGFDAYVNEAIWGVYAPAASTDYHAGDCQLTGNAISFANKNDAEMTAIWVDGVKYEAGSDKLHARGDSCEMALELFSLEEGKTETIHYVSVVGNNNKVTSFAIRVTGFAISGEVSDIDMPGDFAVDNYAKYTGKYFAVFTETAGAESYNIYVDGVLVKNVSGSGYYVTSEELTAAGIANGTHTMAVRAVDANGLESYAATTEVEVVDKGNADDIPQVYISTQGRPITDEYFAKQEGGTNDVNIAIIDNSGTYDDIIDMASDIKIRGNTTAGGDKKPYNIKLDSKEKVLGMDKSKKWSLLANSFDKSLIRNALAMNLANEMGLQYNSECKFVDVYVNGSYDGSYLIIESVETGDGRVEIEAEDETTNDILLELDNAGRDEAEAYHLPRTQLGVYLMLNEPELAPANTTDEDDLADIASYQAKIDNTNTLITNFENALIANDYDEIVKYIDVESFAKFYIVSEFFRNQDINFSSTRFYVKDNVLYAGPCWDFDLSSGNIGQYYAGDYIDGVTYNSFLAQNMAWYTYLMNNETFKATVVNMYNEYQPEITSTYTTMVDELMEKYGASFERNFTSKEELGAGWPIQTADAADFYSYATNGEWETYEEAVTFLTDWLENRNNWLLEKFNAEDIIVSEDLGIIGFQMTASLGGVDGEIGIRTIYQKEPVVNGQEVTELGLVYGLDNGMIADEDMYLGNDNTYVAALTATEAGKLDSVMGDSLTAEYYAMTMDIAGGYTQDYKVRVYAKLADGTVAYSTIASYNILSIAKQLYEGRKMTSGKAHNTLYSMITSIEPEYAKVDYIWNDILVNKPEASENSVKVEGYQMTASYNTEDGTLGLRIIYSAEGDYEEVGLIFGLVYGSDPITAEDMTLAANNQFIMNYPATVAGVTNFTFGSSATATYYTRTMKVSGLNKAGYTATYMVRAYTKDAEGNVTYSDVSSYTINDVASQLYDNDLMGTYNGHQALYDNILTKVDANYKEVEYNWNDTLIRW